jgi:hypothetical protein
MESMLPDLQACLLCEDVRMEVTSAHTLVGVFNAPIPTPGLPVRLFKLCVFTRWCNGMGSFQQETRILHCENETILSATHIDFQIKSAEKFTTNVAVFGNLEFPLAGDYPVEILLNEDLKLRFGFRIVKVQPPFPQMT